MTNDLHRRVLQHQMKAVDGFTSRYNIERLVWYESTGQVLDPLDRERQIKGWRREKKIELIEEDNPGRMIWHAIGTASEGLVGK